MILSPQTSQTLPFTPPSGLFFLALLWLLNSSKRGPFSHLAITCGHICPSLIHAQRRYSTCTHTLWERKGHPRGAVVGMLGGLGESAGKKCHQSGQLSPHLQNRDVRLPVNLNLTSTIGWIFSNACCGVLHLGFDCRCWAAFKMQ